VRAAMFDVLRFWFDRGVDGFRIDVLWHIAKHADLADNPTNPAWTPLVRDRDRLLQLHSTDQPEAHAWSADMRRLADAYGDRVLIGEIFLPNDRHARWYGTQEQPQVHLPFNFQLIENDWNAARLRQIIADYEASLPAFGWPNWVLGSHDAPRIAARIGEAQARVAAMLLLTLRGTPTLYQGDELGIGEVTIPPERMRDPQHHRQPELDIGRDRSRTPMPWSDAPFAGFSSVEPWLPLNDDWRTRNVAAQEAEPESLLHLYRRLLVLRREHDALRVGNIVLTDADDEVLSYLRSSAYATFLVVLNLGTQRRRFVVPEGFTACETLASTGSPHAIDGMVAANEGLVLRLEKEI